MNCPTAILIEGRVYGYGETVQAAWADARCQFSGAPRALQAAMLNIATAKPLTDEEASEVAEMIATPW